MNFPTEIFKFSLFFNINPLKYGKQDEYEEKLNMMSFL